MAKDQANIHLIVIFVQLKMVTKGLVECLPGQSRDQLQLLKTFDARNMAITSGMSDVLISTDITGTLTQQQNLDRETDRQDRQIDGWIDFQLYVVDKIFNSYFKLSNTVS